MAATERTNGLMKSDLVFGFLGAFAIFIAASESFREAPAAAPSPSPWIAAALVVGLMIALAALIVRIARLDKHSSDEFVFTIVTKAAVIGLMTSLVGIQILDFGFLFGGVIPQVTTDHMFALGTGGWSLGYFSYRIRGTAE